MINELDGGIRGAINRALNYGNLRYKMFCILCAKLGYSNHELQDLEVRNRVYQYLKKKYTKYLYATHYTDIDNGKASNDVWVCWLQGIDHAPDIVKQCVKSIERWIPDKTIHFIDQTNLFDYVKLSDYVIEKWKNGIISNTQFSDFIRLSVLTQYGGLWIDATVYMTGPLPDYIKDSHFFLYQSNEYDITKVGESWFMKANSGNRILQTTLDLLDEYWKRENKMRDYFIMFIFMKMSVEKYPDDVMNMIKIPYQIPCLMQKYLEKKYDALIFQELCKISTIHKLTYKLNPNCKKENTYYFKIINTTT